MTGFGGLQVVDGDEDEDAQWAGVAKILGPKWLQLPLLTIGLLGVQILWSVEMSNGTPYLIRLGLSKSLTAAALLAGPLSGLIVQPMIGVIADNSKSRFGRRRPYMMLATLICSMSMLLLGFTRNFVSIFTSIGSSINDLFTIIFAVVALFGIDFSVNAVQALDRALIVDSIPSSLQPDGNAWAARMLNVGSVLGFFIGNLKLEEIFPFIGNTELKVLSAISAFLLISLQIVTAASVKEKVLISSSRKRLNLKGELREIWDNILILPYHIRQICITQFFAWIAWFPVLFYTTVYIGDAYRRTQPLPEDDAASQILSENATILGSRAMFRHSIVALLTTIILPVFVKADGPRSSPDKFSSGPYSRRTKLMESVKIFRVCDLWAAGHLIFASCMFATFFTSSVSGLTWLVTVLGFSWAMTQWAPFTLLAEEILASSPQDEEIDDDSSIRLLDARGRVSSDRRFSIGTVVWDESNEHERLIANGNGHDREGRDSGDEAEEHPVLESRTSSFDGGRPVGTMANAAARHNRTELPTHASRHSNGDVHVHFDTHASQDGGIGDDVMERDLVDDVDTEMRGSNRSASRSGGLQAKSGIIIGIHNLFVVIPQFISTGLVSLIFALFDPAKAVQQNIDSSTDQSQDGRTPIGSSDSGLSKFGRQDAAAGATESSGSALAIIFRLGGVSSVIAFFICLKLARDLRRKSR